ncbi:MAG: zinc-ribbon domain-containing protein [Actinomycetota bacterium]|nr:zinc-ribbon domain-containing protein [Actinomycetota bacterium]
MKCPSCGSEVRETDRFCNACGVRVAAAGDDDAAASDDDAAASDDATSVMAASPVSGEGTAHESGANDEPEPDSEPEDGDGSSSDAPTASEPFPAPTGLRAAAAPGAASTARPPLSDRPVTRQLAHMAGDPTPPPAPVTSSSSEAAPAAHAETRPNAPVGDESAATTRHHQPDAARTTTMGSVGAGGSSAPPTSRTGAVGSTGQVPAAYTPMRAAVRDDAAPTFTLGVLVFIAIGAAGLAAATTITDLVSVDTTSGTPTFDDGTWKLNDLGTNNTVAALIAATLLLVCGILACWRSRLAAGLAGGAGLALAGWAALIVGLAEVPLARASTAITNDPTGTLAGELTRHIGYWVVIAAGLAGILAFLASLVLLPRAPSERALNPWIAALGAAATLVAVAGPLLPERSAQLEDNWTSPVGTDLPMLFFAGRAGQLWALALCGVVGFLVVRRYGLGMALGGFSIVAWLTVTSLLELSSAPIGPAAANPGADNFPVAVPAEGNDLLPHAATVGGVTIALVCALIALIQVAVSASRDRRDRRTP